jgi:hypothetical protein
MRTGRIRIIKQGTVSNIPGSQSAPAPKEKLVKDPTAELISHISGWVTEFKRGPEPIRGSHFRLYSKRCRSSLGETTFFPGFVP